MSHYPHQNNNLNNNINNIQNMNNNINNNNRSSFTPSKGIFLGTTYITTDKNGNKNLVHGGNQQIGTPNFKNPNNINSNNNQNSNQSLLNKNTTSNYTDTKFNTKNQNQNLLYSERQNSNILRGQEEEINFNKGGGNNSRGVNRMSSINNNLNNPQEKFNKNTFNNNFSQSKNNLTFAPIQNNSGYNDSNSNSNSINESGAKPNHNKNLIMKNNNHQVPCPNCGKSYPLLQLVTHVNEECELTIFSCQSCSDEITRANSEEHFNICPKKIVSCSFCYNKMANDELFNHYNNCLYYEQICENCHSLIKRTTHNKEDCFSPMKLFYKNKIKNLEEAIKENRGVTGSEDISMIDDTFNSNINDDEEGELGNN
jgi:hypothetical protein